MTNEEIDKLINQRLDEVYKNLKYGITLEDRGEAKEYAHPPECTCYDCRPYGFGRRRMNKKEWAQFIFENFLQS